MNPRICNRDPGEGQVFLFNDPYEVIAEPVEGLSTSVHDRAQHLIRSMDLLAQASQRAGLQLAVAQPDYRIELEQRYGRNLPKVVTGAADREVRSLAEAKWQFAYAGGYIALKHSDIVSTDEATTIARQDYTEFLNRYAGSENRAARDGFKRQLKRISK